MDPTFPMITTCIIIRGRDQFPRSLIIAHLTIRMSKVLPSRIAQALLIHPWGLVRCSFQTQYSYGNWEAPSVAGLSLDGVLATDTSYNTGIIYLTSYSDTLDFVATDPAVFFDFNITSFFTITVDLNISSYSFYSGTYELTTPHALTLTNVDYLFNSSIYDSYLNNIDQGSLKSLTPNLSLVSSETLSIEVIISDQAYIPAYTRSSDSIGKYHHGIHERALQSNRNRHQIFQ